MEKTPSRIKEYAKNHRFSLALGALALSTVVSIPAFASHEHAVVKALPEVGVGLAVTEGMFVGGIGLMAASQKKKVMTKEIFSKKYIKEEVLGKPVDANWGFRAGLGINSVGALGSGLVVGIGAIEALPPAMIVPSLALAGLDIAATVAIRYNIYKAINHPDEAQHS
jgi:hypothetical protein